MLYEVDPNFDLAAWESEVTGKTDREALMSPERVRELCNGAATKPNLAKSIQSDCGCSRATAYRHIQRADKAKTIQWSKASETYIAK